MKIFIALFAALLILSASLSLFADIGGRTTRTRKTSTSGCGSCHGSSGTAGVSVTISGPDTVAAGQTVQFSMIINRTGKTGAGLDIAIRRGTLGAVSSGTRVQSGEITHNDNLLMSNGTVTVLFNYTAPTTIGLDTIWTTGIATNTGGNSSGDEWNWSANKRIFVNLGAGSINLNMKTLIEALYLYYPLSNLLSRKDTLSVYLRQSVFPYSNIDSAKGTIDSTNFSGLFSFFNSPSGTYYIVLKHFQSIETLSRLGGEILQNNGSIYSYDFTTSASQAYGNNLKLKGGKYCIVSGDVFQDGFIDGSDLLIIDNDAYTFATGRFLPSDVNGDGFADAMDMQIADNNRSREVIRP